MRKRGVSKFGFALLALCHRANLRGNSLPVRGTMKRLVSILCALLPALVFALEPVEPGELSRFVVERGAVIVDVRSAQEYAAGHVPGAINLPHDRIVDDPALLATYRDRPLVLYCRSGRRAGLAAESLERAGFDLYHLRGDMPGWERQGLPLASGTAPDCRNC